MIRIVVRVRSFFSFVATYLTNGRFFLVRDNISHYLSFRRLSQPLKKQTTSATVDDVNARDCTLFYSALYILHTHRRIHSHPHTPNTLAFSLTHTHPPSVSNKWWSTRARPIQSPRWTRRYYYFYCLTHTHTIRYVGWTVCLCVVFCRARVCACVSKHTSGGET